MKPATKRLVAILGIDTVREKTLYQTRWLAEHEFRCHILTYHRDDGSITDDPSAEIEPIAAGFGVRLRQAFRFLRAHRREIHHAELYPAGRFAWIFAVLCRVLGVKLIVVERGDIRYYHERLHPLSIRLSMYTCYRLAHAVWYREPHMEAALGRWRLRRLFFLPNAVPVPANGTGTDARAGDRPIDFVWVNRLVPERHPDWLADAVVDLSREHRVSCDILGFSTSRRFSDFGSLEARVRATLSDLPRVHCLDYTDPVPYYGRARFFVLPADVVFGNFALLEAMAHGVVPIVSDVADADRIVEHGVNGYLVEHNAKELVTAMQQALALNEKDWARLSVAARTTVATRFSIETWGKQLLREYTTL